MTLLAAAGACSPAPSAPAASVAAVDCREVLEMSPPEAADYLAAHGLSVSWRVEMTTEEGPMAEVVTTTPTGVITDVLVEGTEAIVFVTPADDPLLHEAAIGQNCL